MIVLEKNSPIPSDPRLRAGYQAEQQMAFYLRRAFADSADILVFNDLRLERHGEVAQMDHLVLHRYGFVVVESKSVVEKVAVNRQGEFTRFHNGRAKGMQSPIRQAMLQAELLSKLLNDHKANLRRKVLFGTKQGYFGEDRFRVLVAISDGGIIERKNCDPPELCKADRITDVIEEIITRHASARGLGGFMKSLVAKGEAAKQLERNALMALSVDELNALWEFLLESHVPSTIR